jgi:hypothetical protein
MLATSIKQQEAPMATETYEQRTARDATDVQHGFETISHVIKGGHNAVNALADVVSNEHPTLSGQFAKATAIGIVRRATYNPEWKPFDTWERDCTEETYTAPDTTPIPKHPEHDRRHSCALIAGAVLMAQQWYL